MSISVIVVSYNSRADLPACLHAINAQLDPEDELIVVDNGSSDNSVAFVSAHFPNARLLCGPNTGYAGGNNRGAAAATGDYLVFLNPDTVVQPGAITALVAPLRCIAGIGLTTACLVFAHAAHQVNACGNTMHYTGLTYCRGAGRPHSAYTEPADVDAVSGAAFAISRALFLYLGGFDERFFMYVEDSDLSWRARLTGLRIRYVPEAVVTHAYTLSYSPTKAYYLDRNRHLMLFENLAWATYLRMLPALLLSELVTGGYVLLRGPRYWGVKFRVYRGLWQQRATIPAARRQVEALCQHPDAVVLAQTADSLDLAQLAAPWLAMLMGKFLVPAYKLLRPRGFM